MTVFRRLMEGQFLVSFSIAFALVAHARAEMAVHPSSWHLAKVNDDCRICLEAESVWAVYGSGSSGVEQIILEHRRSNELFEDVLTHSGIQNRFIEYLYPSHSQSLDREGFTSPGKMLLRCELLANTRANNQSASQRYTSSNCDKVFDDALQARRSYYNWQGQHNHELRMVGLVVGQKGDASIGLAPEVRVTVAYHDEAWVAEKLGTDIEALEFALEPKWRRLSAADVISYAVGSGEKQSIDEHYERVYRIASWLSRFGGEGTGSPLIVAASGNRAEFIEQGSNLVLPKPPLNMPQDFVYQAADLKPRITSTRIRRPFIANSLPRPHLPVIFVGGVTRDGRPFANRRDPTIEIYAPSGDDPIAEADLSQNDLRFCTYDFFLSVHIDASHDNCVRSEFKRSRILTLDTSGLSKTNGIAAQYAGITGTSSSATLVGATVSLMKTVYPRMNAYEAKTLLLQSARTEFGIPVLNTFGAVEAAANANLKIALNISQDRVLNLFEGEHFIDFDQLNITASCVDENRLVGLVRLPRESDVTAYHGFTIEVNIDGGPPTPLVQRVPASFPSTKESFYESFC